MCLYIDVLDDGTVQGICRCMYDIHIQTLQI